jgi:hypothetical protein
MRPTHYIQLAMAVILAMLGAASLAFPQYWHLFTGLGLIVAAGMKPLSVASELHGDRDASVGESPAQSNAVAKAAKSIAPLACLALLLGCSNPAPVIQNAALAADVAAYTAESQDCVAGSANMAAYRNCVAQVRARWCGPGGTLQVANGCGDAGVDASMPVPPAVMKLFGFADAAPPAAPVAVVNVAPAPVVDAGGQ